MNREEDFKIIYGRDEEFRKEIEQIPYIKFPSHWYVKPIGPFGGASVRFIVTTDPNNKNIWVSVYADLHSRLGFYGDGEPHWEVYPDKNNDNSRCPLDDTKELLSMIEDSLREQGE